MTALKFPTAPILPTQDPTEMAWNTVAGIATDFERAAIDATSPGRCAQLHERIYACLQTLNDADDLVRSRWDGLLAKGLD